MPVPTLILESPMKEPRTVELNKPRMVVGRHPQCDVLIDNVSVSRQHCELTARGITYVIRDMQTANKTFVNGREIQEHVLQDGDVIVIGNNKLTYRNPNKTVVDPHASTITADLIPARQVKKIVEEDASAKKTEAVPVGAYDPEATLRKPDLAEGKSASKLVAAEKGAPVESAPAVQDDLAEVTRAWASLPAGVRAGILSIVRAVNSPEKPDAKPK